MLEHEPMPVRRAQLATLLWATFTTATVRAQTPNAPVEAPGAGVVDEAAAPPPGDAPQASPDVTEPAAPAAVVPAPASADSARLDDVEQVARIALRKTELLEEDAAKRPQGAATVVVDDKGFVLKLADDTTKLRVAGLLQADGRFSFKDDALQSNDAFLIRKFRPMLEGTLFNLVDYRLLSELAGTVQILDAYADLRPSPWLRLRIGKFKGPIGLERLQSDADVPLLERALDQNLSSVREVGLQLWGDIAGGAAQYILAVVDGAPDGASPDNDFNHAKDLAGRLFFQPFRGESAGDFGSLGIGFAASIGNRKGRLPSATAAAVTGLPAFKTSGQNTFFQYFAPATDTTGATTTLAHQLETHLNPQVYYYYQGFGLLAEYVILRQGVQRGNATATLTHQATHATLSYVVGGVVGFNGVTPTAPFDRKAGSVGAFEVALRWGWLKVDDASFGDPNVVGSAQYADPLRSARSAQAWAAGLTWVPARSFHLALNFEQTSFKGGAGTATAPADRRTENVAIGRAQVSF